MVLAIGIAYKSFGGLPWMQAIFYGVGAAVVGIIAISSYKLTVKSIRHHWVLWVFFVISLVVTIVTEREEVLLFIIAGLLYMFLKVPPKAFLSGPLIQIAWFFTKAGAFVFGSGLAIVPFLHSGVVTDFEWLTENEFLDAVAVAMITPGPVVITVGFIGYLVAGFPGACVAALATFLPCYLFTIIPAPYFKRYGKHPSIKAFVDGVTAAAIGAIIGAVFVLGKRQFTDTTSVIIAAITILVLLKYKKIQEPFIILVAAVIGVLVKTYS